MANQPELIQFDAGVYQIESSDPVDGGVNSITNRPLLSLSNRTAWLKKHVDDLESGATIPLGLAKIDSPGFTGTPTAPTQAAGDNSTKIATDAFVQAAVNGSVSVSVAGNTTTTLTQAQYGVAIITLTGALTGDKAVVFPAVTGHWQVINTTTGNFTLTLKTASGTGVAITRNTSTNIYCDGTNVGLQQSDFNSTAFSGAPTAPTATVGTNTTQIATMAALLQGMAAFGLGATQMPNLSDANLATQTGLFRLTTNASNSPIAGTAAVILNLQYTATLAYQLAISAGRVFTRQQVDATTFTLWEEDAKRNSPAFTGTPTAPTLARFATGGGLMTADAVKAAGIRVNTFKAVTLSGATVTLVASDAGALVEISSVGGGTLNLPLANTVPKGEMIVIRSSASASATDTVKVQGSDILVGTFSGYASAKQGSLRRGDSIAAMSDGVSAWICASESTAGFVADQFTRGQLLAVNGYQKLPGGMILQCCSVRYNSSLAGGAEATQAFTFPTAFANAALQVVACMSGGSYGQGGLATVFSQTVNGGEIKFANPAGNAAWTYANASVIAIGY